MSGLSSDGPDERSAAGCSTRAPLDGVGDPARRRGSRRTPRPQAGARSGRRSHSIPDHRPARSIDAAGSRTRTSRGRSRTTWRRAEPAVAGRDRRSIPGVSRGRRHRVDAAATRARSPSTTHDRADRRVGARPRPQRRVSAAVLGPLAGVPGRSLRHGRCQPPGRSPVARRAPATRSPEDGGPRMQRTVDSGECPIGGRATLDGQMSRKAQYVQAR